MDFPQGKRFLGWYLKERDKRPCSIVLLAVQDKCALKLLTEEEVSRFQLVTIGALVIEDINLCRNIEEYFHEVNDTYDAVKKEYGIR